MDNQYVSERKKRKSGLDTIKYFTQEELKRFFRQFEKYTYRMGEKEMGQEGFNREEWAWLRDYAIFRVAYRCGLRASELGLIYVYDYNPLKGEVYCKRKKGSQNNTIRLDPETKKVLQRYIKKFNLTDRDILFQSKQYKPISRQMLDVLFKRYCHSAKLVNVQKFHFHALKHSIAVHLAEAGADLKEIQNWLGHKVVANTEIYFSFTTRQQEAMYSKVDTSGMLV